MARTIRKTDARQLPPFLMGDDKRTKILRAAHKLFLRDGLALTSMDSVTLEAGVSKATVYAHFESKEKLFETLTLLGSESALAMAPALIRGKGNPSDELLAFFKPFLMLLFGYDGYAWSRLLIAEAHRHPMDAARFFDSSIGNIAKQVENYLQSLADDGLFPAEEVSLSAESLIAMVLLGPLQRVLALGLESVDVEATARFGIDMVLKWGEGTAKPRRRKARN